MAAIRRSWSKNSSVMQRFPVVLGNNAGTPIADAAYRFDAALVLQSAA
jgi:hypothetical protein